MTVCCLYCFNEVQFQLCTQLIYGAQLEKKLVHSYYVCVCTIRLCPY